MLEIMKEIGSTPENEYEDIKMEFELCETVGNGDETGKKCNNNRKRCMIVKCDIDVTIAKDSKLLVEKVTEARGLNAETVKSRTVIDTGNNSLKVCVSIVDEKMDPKMAFNKENCLKEMMTGVNRLIILAEIDGGQECHYNLSKLLEKLKLHCLPGLVLVGDLSVMNVYFGLSKHGGKYACYVCDGCSNLKSGKLRTFGSLHNHYQAYKTAGSKPKDMKTLKNVINECLIDGESEELVGEKHPLPELHLLIRVVNHYCKVLLKVWPGLKFWE